MIELIREQYNKLCPIPCTACKYCLPCPEGVSIPENFEFHKDRTRKLLEKAQDRFNRADDYLTGEGLGGVSVKTSSAQGAIRKGHSALKEAIWNAQKAIKYGNSEQEKILQIKSVIDEFTETPFPFKLDTYLSASCLSWDTEFERKRT